MNKQKPPHEAGVFVAGLSRALFLVGFFLVGLLVVGLQEARELLLEARQAAAAVDQMLLAAGPGRVRLRIDVEMHDIALLAPGGAGGEFAAIGHHDLDGMVVRMDILLHGTGSVGAKWGAKMSAIWRVYTGRKPGRQAAAIDPDQARRALSGRF